MATRSTIVLKIRKEDIGKTLTFDPSKMKKAFDNKFPFEPVTITGEYMEIYHHWDGYPDGVGETLLTEFNDYDSILNLMLMGDMSSIVGNSVCSYHGWRNEDTPPHFHDSEPSCSEEYLYVFKDGHWHVTEEYSDDMVDVSLEDVLNRGWIR